MLGRAKKHPNKTADMDEAILVFETWMLDYKKASFQYNLIILLWYIFAILKDQSI